MNSDVPWYYGLVMDKYTNEIVAPSDNPKWKRPTEDFFG
jgi:hypothetical protein